MLISCDVMMNVSGPWKWYSWLALIDWDVEAAIGPWNDWQVVWHSHYKSQCGAPSRHVTDCMHGCVCVGVHCDWRSAYLTESASWKGVWIGVRLMTGCSVESGIALWECVSDWGEWELLKCSVWGDQPTGIPSSNVILGDLPELTCLVSTGG